MVTKNLRLNELINKRDLMGRLKALTRESGGDGSDFKIRAEVLAILKEASATGRKKTEEMLFEDGDGTKCSRRISFIQDEIISIIYEFAVRHVYRLTNASAGEHLAITAVGGYGRGTLAPGSDIDLLFLLPYKQTAWGEQVVEYILYMLWDMGFKVGHATRNIDECIRRSRQDMTIRTSILEMRFIEGHEELFKELAERFQNEIVASSADEFVVAKLAERDHRHRKTGESRYLVEPNVKDGKGGLRDLHTLFWIAKYSYNVGRSRDLIKAGLFTRSEYQRFRNAERFLWTVRCHMHFLTGRAEERLSFDIQREMATRLKYVTHGGLLDVERFMKHYFLVAREVGFLTLVICSELEEKLATSISRFNDFLRSLNFRRNRKIKGTRDFIVVNGRICNASEEVFKDDPVNMLRLFQFAETNQLDFHPDALSTLHKSLKYVGRDMRNSRQANDIFLELLTTARDPENLFRRMNEAGLLGRFVPAFNKIVAMMQFNMYHHYTVDEHLLRSIGVLKGLQNGEIAKDHPVSADLIREVLDPKILYVALFLHDIAKGRKEDHSIAGARIAKSFCKRLNFTDEEIELVSWLVREHLTMSIIAQSRDLSDRKTIEDFAHRVQTLERMRYLMLLTVCDIRAVGPGVWNGWKGQLLRTLYFETEVLLTGGFSQLKRQDRVDAAKQRLHNALPDWSEEDKTRIINLPYSAYYLSTGFDTQLRNAEFIRKSDAGGLKLATMVRTMDFEAITEITVLAPDHPRLVSIIAGACVAAGANIADARIHTTNDGRALDSILINREFDDEADELRRAANIGQMIERVLSGKERLPEMIARKNRQKSPSKTFRVPPKVQVNNEFSNEFTVILVEGLDRPGLLSELTGALADLNLDIGSAHIVTFGEKVSDSFYVRDLMGYKITSQNRRNRIIKVLMEVLSNTYKAKPAAKDTKTSRDPAAEHKEKSDNS